MKKILTPILHFIFAIPVFSLILISLGAFEQIIGFLFPWGRNGAVEGLLIFGLTTLGVFYLANFVVQKIEHLKKPNIIDHFRQSSIFYIIFFYTGTKSLLWYIKYPISTCKTDCHGYFIIFLSVFIPLSAIIINGYYLYKLKHRTA